MRSKKCLKCKEVSLLATTLKEMSIKHGVLCKLRRGEGCCYIRNFTQCGVDDVKFNYVKRASERDFFNENFNFHTASEKLLSLLSSLYHIRMDDEEDFMVFNFSTTTAKEKNSALRVWFRWNHIPSISDEGNWEWTKKRRAIKSNDII